MGWFILKHIFSTIFPFITIGLRSNPEKDHEILVLRQQFSILQRKLNRPFKPNRVEKMTLAVLTAKLKRISHQSTNQLRDVIHIFQPETIRRQPELFWQKEFIHKYKSPSSLSGLADNQFIGHFNGTTVSWRGSVDPLE